MNRKEIIFLSCIAFVAFALRSYLLQTHLFFGPEQGRDFLVIRDMVLNHKWTLIGPKTDIDGIFHGPFYYYLAAIPFAVSHGNPFVVTLFFICIQSVTVFFIYLLSFELTKSKRAGYLAAILYAVSFGSIVYARWLSNPPLSIPLSVLFFLFFLRFLHGKKRYLIGISIIYGLLGQVEFINYYIYGVIIFLLMLIYRRVLLKTDKKIIAITFIAGGIVSFSNIILFDLRHKFLITQSLFGLLSGKSGYFMPLARSLYENIAMTYWQYIYVIAANYKILGCILLLGSIGVILHTMKKNKHLMLLLIWIITPALLLSILRHNVLEQLYVGVIAGFILATAVFINWVMDRSSIVIGGGFLMLLIFINIHALFVNLPENNNVFFQNPQPSVRYSDQNSVIKWVYENSDDTDFSIQAYTIPYWWQDAWIYLFWYNARIKKLRSPVSEKAGQLFVIIQKEYSNPLFQKNWYDTTVSSWGTKVASQTIGEYTIEKLIVTNK